VRPAPKKAGAASQGKGERLYCAARPVAIATCPNRKDVGGAFTPAGASYPDMGLD